MLQEAASRLSCCRFLLAHVLIRAWAPARQLAFLRQVALVVDMHVLPVLLRSLGADLVDMHGLSLPLLRRHPAARLVLALLRRPP